MTSVFSIDVECIATGRGHSARAVCSVAVVDSSERVLLNSIVCPDMPVYNYLTPITGFREGDLDGGMPLSQVIADVKALLSPQAVLVGQSPANDIEWLGLVAGVHFASVIDLSKMFEAYNPRYRNYSRFSLQHEAAVLLNSPPQHAHHDPSVDALNSIRLYMRYQGRPHELETAKLALLNTRPAPSVAKILDYHCDDVCMAAYFPDKCKCGEPTKAEKRGS
eukprot:Opistho-2@84353